jgi:hypothetical protein
VASKAPNEIAALSPFLTLSSAVPPPEPMTIPVVKAGAYVKVSAMQLGYLKPCSFRIEPRPEPKRSGPTVTGVRQGVTEIRLSDGRLIRAQLHVTSVKADPAKPGNVELSYTVVAKVMAEPASLVHDVHQTIQ